MREGGRDAESEEEESERETVMVPAAPPRGGEGLTLDHPHVIGPVANGQTDCLLLLLHQVHHLFLSWQSSTHTQQSYTVTVTTRGYSENNYSLLVFPN